MIKFLLLLVIMTTIWQVHWVEAVAASSTVETLPLTQLTPAANIRFQAGQLESGPGLTPPTTLTMTQTSLAVAPPDPTVCPPSEATEVGFYQSLLVNSFFRATAGIAETLQPGSALKERVNILLLGSDNLPDEKYGHTDTMILVTVDPVAKTAGMLSIPRDLWVSIPGYGENRINQAYRLGQLKDHPAGGLALAAETVETNLGVPVHFYALIDFKNFRQIIDTLHGIDICVPETIDAASHYGYVPQVVYSDSYYSYVPVGLEPIASTIADAELSYKTSQSDQVIGYKFLYIEAGPHTFDGETALRYARTRATTTADFARVQRQQAVLLAIRDKALQVGAIPRLPELWRAMGHLVETNLQLAEVLQLAQLAYEIPVTSIQATAISHDQTVNYKTSSGAQVLLPRRTEIKALVTEMFGASTPTAPLTRAEVEQNELAQANPGYN
ncbi:MAG TPA: LCP family protein [Anaerolineae bacterium]|nr:LCP family protein [Anaerolineae bacterium]